MSRIYLLNVALLSAGKQLGSGLIVSVPILPPVSDVTDRGPMTSGILNEVVIPMNGVKHWLWRAVDSNGDVLHILVQGRRNAKAAKRFMVRLIT